MIRRTMDGANLTRIANDPEVRPWIGGEGVMDLGPLLSDPANYGIEADHGGWLLHPILPGVYELHSLFLKEGRGKPFFAAAREMFRFMFAETDCLEIVTKCPDDNPAARMAAATVGFRERFRREDAWAPGVGISYQVFSVDDWVARDGECLAQGEAFHDALKAAQITAGSDRPFHPDDEAHDRAVGAATLMIRGGYTAKGVGFYNRFAKFAGYAEVQAVGPRTIDVVDAVVEVVPTGFEVLLCR